YGTTCYRLPERLRWRFDPWPIIRTSNLARGAGNNMNSRFAKCKFGLHLVQSKEIMSCSGTTTVACYPRLDDNWRTHVTHCTAPDAVEPACRRIVKPGRTGWLPTFHSGQDRRQYPCVRRPRACANGSLCETTLSSS